MNVSARAGNLEIPTGRLGTRVKTAFGNPRDFLDNRFVYVVISPRARGLSIGINMNPNQFCNFDCAYCEVNRDLPAAEQELDVFVMAEELQKTLLLVRSGGIREFEPYRTLSADLLELRHVAFSGDGEPTLCPNFSEAVQKVIQVRARYRHSFFKLALITNGARLDLPDVQNSLACFTSDDEIWIKLDAGTQDYMDKINRSEIPLGNVIENILLTGRKRPVIIQSLFPLIEGQEPPLEEIDQYIRRLSELKSGGAEISLVQIYSATRPTPHSECGHLPLKSLANIRRRITAETGLKAEVF
jgi:wyosine [tRNA(Phe)-imidazoG37] synthetase (radical SAM superfamily)